MAENQNCVQFVPLSDYDWGFSNGPSWLPWNPVVVSLLVTFSALAYYISAELLILVLLKFKRRNSVYFWSIIATTCGVVLQTTGYLLSKFENKCPLALVILIAKVGWTCNVTGFSLVLWSRLHLVIKDPRILKGVLVMIVFDAVLFHGSVIILDFAMLSKLQPRFYFASIVAEKMQQIVFSAQESFIAVLYIYYSYRFFTGGYATRTRNVVGSLVALQILVVAMDILLTFLFFTNKVTIKCMLHPLFFALKLRLEFVVLNLLRGLCKGGLTGTAMAVSATTYGSAPPDGKSLALSRSRTNASVDVAPRSWSWAEETAVSGGRDASERQRKASELTMVEDWDGHFTGGPSWKAT